MSALYNSNSAFYHSILLYSCSQMLRASPQLLAPVLASQLKGFQLFYKNIRCLGSYYGCILHSVYILLIHKLLKSFMLGSDLSLFLNLKSPRCIDLLFNKLTPSCKKELTLKRLDEATKSKNNIINTSLRPFIITYC